MGRGALQPDLRAGRQATAHLGLPLILEVQRPHRPRSRPSPGFHEVDAGLRRERMIFSGADAIGVVSTALFGYVQDRIDRDVRRPVDRQWCRRRRLPRRDTGPPRRPDDRSPSGLLAA